VELTVWNGATAAHPGVVHADHGETMLLRALDRHFRGAHQRVHTAVIAAVDHRRHRRFVHHLQAPPRLAQIHVFKYIEQFGQSGVFVSAQRRIQHVIGDDAGLFVVVSGFSQRIDGKHAGFCCGEAHAVR
jgi:hypothetical protein